MWFVFSSSDYDKQRKYGYFTFLIYLITVIWFTVFSRGLSFQYANYDLFWSYKRWIAGNTNTGYQILANMIMFVPFGFLMTEIMQIQKKLWKKYFAIIVVAAVFFSGLIEIFQFVLLRGLFELDDIISNTCGAIVGIFICRAVKRITSGGNIIILIAYTGIIVACFFIFIDNRRFVKFDTANEANNYCFQIDKVLYENEVVMKINGFMFSYEYGKMPVELFLKSSETGEKYKLEIEYGSARPDVNEYFLCEHDYTNSGFTAVVSNDNLGDNEEYEIMMKWPGRIMYSSGVFIKGSDIYYAPENKFIAPEASGADLWKIIEEGDLRVWRPDYHCWVYQIGTSLYWIVDQDFNFEDDGSTYIQYQLYTTQTDKLPEKRLKHNWLWDNIGGDFEKYELDGDFGSCRVMKRDLPKEYSITSIVTGYYKNGKWIWNNSFRPVYHLCNMSDN